MKFIVCDTYEEMSKIGADMFAEVIKNDPKCILGLATGSTPIGMYGELIRMNKAGEISFKEVTTYNLDEYYQLSPEHPQSYRYFMNNNLFNYVDINKDNTFVPDGFAEDPNAYGKEYDAKIEAAGGIDIQVLGLGVNGHIAFNEPADELCASTHLTDLTESTIKANSRFFDSEDEVPKKALTMGLGSIMRSKKIIVLANGVAKHDVIAKLCGDEITTSCPATLLKCHRDVTVICDKAAYNG